MKTHNDNTPDEEERRETIRLLTSGVMREPDALTRRWTKEAPMS